ncbi:Rha family transcriptional regulator [Weissella confusa]|uniref:Rha family transcriptional regulator n=1 Tax=Weissella confusa TaxID=1583 RepID=UPI001C6F9654|nr:Rha family transcriptional regulator [Weissella confusa]QYU57482.1 Rha family transcriptional regulator [Weissella confusa]
MADLVMYGTPAEGVYTTNEIVAKYTGVEVRTVNKLTNKYMKRLERFGKMRFEISPLPSGQKKKIWHYNEQQATLLITFMRNTDAVVEFKSNLVAAFYSQREELTAKTIALANIKTTNKTLADVVHDKFPGNKFMYATVHDLALKIATGKRAKQLKVEFGVSDAQDALTAEQLDRLEQTRSVIATLLDYGLTYDAVKQALAKQPAAG